jgi:Collagen triple helix repeat (20 copies)
MSLRLSIAVCIILSCVCINGCTKNGSSGTQGAQGPVGPAGASGTIIYSGTTAPDPSVGNAGDFYLDLTSGVLFGPKTASGWGSGFAMKGTAGATGATGSAGATGAAGPPGPRGATGASGATGATGATGAAGAAGSQIFSGDGAPSASLGQTGDFYLDKSGFNLYGPKLASGWGVPIMLQGPEGTANVEYSPWFGAPDVTTDPSQNLVYVDLLVPAISQSIMDQGTVVVYSDMKGYTGDEWPQNYIVQLPATVIYPPLTDYWSIESALSLIRIQVYDTLMSYTEDQMFATSFRIVIVPGGVSIPPGINFDDLLRYLRAKKEN